MTDSTLSIGIFRAALASTDRRTISQAWYSALHVAERSRNHSSATRVAAGTQQLPAARSICPQPKELGANARAATLVRRSGSRTYLLLERRMVPSVLARKLVLRLRAGAARAVARDAFAIAAPGGRVQIFLRTAGGTVRLIALCSAAMKDSVARALAHATHALARRRIALESSVCIEVPR